MLSWRDKLCILFNQHWTGKSTKKKNKTIKPALPETVPRTEASLAVFIKAEELVCVFRAQRGQLTSSGTAGREAAGRQCECPEVFL